MAFNDPVAEYLTRIRNALLAKHKYVDINISKMRVSITKILQKQGFIENFLVNEQCKKIRIFLKYNDKRESIIHGLKRISSPGFRKYIKHDQIPRIFGGIGVVLLSTSQNIVEGEEARRKKLGGELLCSIW
jgi:small subunit ribosomal protein S8